MGIRSKFAKHVGGHLLKSQYDGMKTGHDLCWALDKDNKVLRVGGTIIGAFGGSVKAGVDIINPMNIAKTISSKEEDMDKLLDGIDYDFFDFE